MALGLHICVSDMIVSTVRCLPTALSQRDAAAAHGDAPINRYQTAQPVGPRNGNFGNEQK